MEADYDHELEEEGMDYEAEQRDIQDKQVRERKNEKSQNPNI